MKNTAKTFIQNSIKNIFLIIIIALTALSFSCNTPNNKTSKTKHATTQKVRHKKHKKQHKKEFPRLSNSNVVKVLTQYGKTHKSTLAVIKTDMGDITVKLYKQTPLHRANFIMLANRHFYDQTIFYRVEKGFIIQGGDSDDMDRVSMKYKIGSYTIPAEMHPNRYFHKRGALSMARFYEDNPEKRSSRFEFFIVQGTKYSDADLNQIEKDNGFKFTPYQRKYYKTIGGAAHLDNQHTVFGEVIKGMDIVDKIANVKVDRKKWPKKNIFMDIKVIN